MGGQTRDAVFENLQFVMYSLLSQLPLLSSLCKAMLHYLLFESLSTQQSIMDSTEFGKNPIDTFKIA